MDRRYADPWYPEPSWPRCRGAAYSGKCVIEYISSVEADVASAADEASDSSPYADDRRKDRADRPSVGSYSPAEYAANSLAREEIWRIEDNCYRADTAETASVSADDTVEPSSRLRREEADRAGN